MIFIISLSCIPLIFCIIKNYKVAGLFNLSQQLILGVFLQGLTPNVFVVNKLYFVKQNINDKT